MILYSELQRCAQMIVATLAIFGLPSGALADPTTFDVTLSLASEDTFQSPDLRRATLATTGSVEDIRYGFSLTANPTQLTFDHSFIEWRNGPLTFGIGAIDRHWGPSQYSSLILSDNARPVPSLYIAYDAPEGLSLPALKYLGPLSLETFHGQLEADRPIANTKLFGAQLTFEPANNLTISLVRTAQWGGEGYDNSFSAFLRMLAGQEDVGDEPNQLAGYSVSYMFTSGLRGYFQAIGEDEASSLPTCYSRMAGIEGPSRLFGYPTLLTLEAVDTTIERTTSGNCGPNTAYRNSHYPGGYTHYGRVMGVPIDTEGQSLTLYGQSDLSDIDVEWQVGYADVNREALPTHRLSSHRERAGFAALAISRHFGETSVTGSLRYQGLDLNKAYGNKGISFGLTLSHRF